MPQVPVGSPLSLHDPRQVGPWEIHSRLGSGGMGVVFYASSPDMQGVALKVIHPGLLDAPATRDRFRREVAVLRSVHDAYICQFLAADLESEPGWLAVEYVAGPTLREQVMDNGPLTEADWWELANGMAQALAVLDKHRITHRDLKPGNVILSATGPQLIDFGIAHPEDATSLTATGLVTGSPAWLSPEQATLDPIGPPSDVFALGSLLAYSATGRPPFGEGASVAVLMSIATREPDLAGIDPIRTALLQRMLAKDPTSRPTARQVLDRLRESAPSGDATRMDTGHATVVMPAVLPPATSDVEDIPHPSDVPDHGDGTDDVTGSTTVPGGAPAVSPAAPPPRPAGVGPAAPTPPPELLPPDSPPPVAPLGVPEMVAAAPVTAPPRGSAPARPRGQGPRAAAARRRRARRRRTLTIALIALAMLVGGWLVVQGMSGGSAGSSGSAASGGNGDASSPASSAEPPPAPGTDQLRDGPWLLERYRLNNTSGLTVTGTVRNTGDSTASADLTTWIYLGDESLGSVATTVTDVPAGGAVEVQMTGDAQWKQGLKTVLLQAS